MNVLRVEGSMAIRSIPAYVERSDFILILVPSLYHSDRKVPTCYRTWRRRGWCLLELYAAAMARDSSNPPLLVRSERGTPIWMRLLDAGASLDYRTFGGGSVLTSLTTNEDSDPDVLRLVFEKLLLSCREEELSSIVNYKRSSTTLKWKGIYCLAKIMYRTGASKSGLMRHLAVESGTTALNIAVMRGDIEIVKILLENGADPYVENDLGMNAFDICNKAGPFPSVNRALQEHVNEE
eukprot:g2694.t1